MSDATLLRIVIAVLGAILLAAIYFYGRPRRPQQGKRTERRPSGRVEPTLGDSDGVADDGLEPGVRDELERRGREIADDDAGADPVGRELPLAPSFRSSCGSISRRALPISLPGSA